MLTRSTRSSTRAAASAAPAPVEPVAVPAKKRAAKKSVAPLADRTNTAQADAPMHLDAAAPVKEVLSFANLDMDALTAVADKEEEKTVEPVKQTTATTTVPAQPSLVYAQIDPEILALKVKRAPIVASVAPIAPIAPIASPIAESRRVQFEYNDAGCEIGQHLVAPAYAAIGSSADDDEEEESSFTHEFNEEDAEDLTRLGEVERMAMPAAAAAEAELPSLFHAAALTKHSVGLASSSGFLPAGIVSSHAVRSVKLDLASDDAPVPAFLLAAAPSAETNQVKANGFLAAGSIDVNKIGSKKIA